MKFIISTIILVVLMIYILPMYCQYREEPYRHFEQYNKVLHKGLWVPDIFPKDIKNIHEQHDIDTNQVWLRFTLGEKDIDLSKFKKIDMSEVNYTKPFLSTWWFSGPTEDYVYYHGRCTDDTQSTMAVSKSSKIVYWWC